MEPFVCEFTLSGIPTPVKSGQMLHIAATVSAANAEVASIVLSVPEGGVYETLKKAADGTFAARLSVPYGGAGMRVNAIFYAMSADGRRSERKIVPVRVE